MTLAEWGVTQDEARDLLRRQMCPACGEGPWKSPMMHAAKRHGIDRFTMRDICGLTLGEPVADPELLERFAERGRAIDMSTVNHKGKPRKPQRWTRTGIAKNTANVLAFNATPAGEAQRMAGLAIAHAPAARAKQAATLRAQWAKLTPDERRAKTNLPIRSAEDQATSR